MHQRHNKKFPVNNAISQYERWLPALNADYAPIEGRSFSDLMNFSVSFARFINYYNGQNKKDGDWVDFFISDPSIILASIAATNPKKYEQEYEIRERKTRISHCFNEKFENLRNMCNVITDIAHEINNCLIGLRVNYQNKNAMLLLQDIENEISDNLNNALGKLLSYDKGAGLDSALCECLNLNYTNLSSPWNLKNIQENGSIYTGVCALTKINHSLPYFRPILNEFLCSLKSLRYRAEYLMLGTLDGADHKPQSTLYIAFAKLFEYAQDNVNQFSSRFIDFYYNDVLQETSQKAIADQVYLNVSLVEDENIVNSTLPKGTLFDAGQDENDNDIVFSANNAISATSALLSKIHTLNTPYGELIIKTEKTVSSTLPMQESNHRATLSNDQMSNASLETCAPVIQQVISSNIFNLNGGNDEDAQSETVSPETSVAILGDDQQYEHDENPNHLHGWPTFGATHVSKSNTETNEHAVLGFAIASSEFLLREGDRAITINCELQTTDTLTEQLTEIDCYVNLGLSEVLTHILKASLKLYISVGSGWMNLKEYKIEAIYLTSSANSDIVVNNSLNITFTLPDQAPAFIPIASDEDEENGDEEDDASAYVSLNASVNATNPAPSLPTLKAYLKQSPIKIQGADESVWLYPLSILSALDIEGYSINCDVSNIVAAVLENDDGEIDSSVPYPLFGSLPVYQSSFYIRYDEIFEKNIHALNISLQWFNLPQNDDGFYGYYKNYIIDINDDIKKPGELFNNTTFQNTIQVKNPGFWSIDSKYTIKDDGTCKEKYLKNEYLFRTEKNPCGIPEKAKKLDAITLFDNLSIISQSSPDYYTPSESRINVTLSNPTYAFGNDLYTKNVLKAVLDDLPDADSCIIECDEKVFPLAEALSVIDAALEKCKGASNLNCFVAAIISVIEMIVLYRICTIDCMSKSPNAETQIASLNTLFTALSNALTHLKNAPEKLTVNVTEEENRSIERISRNITGLASLTEEECETCEALYATLSGLWAAIIVCASNGSDDQAACVISGLQSVSKNLTVTTLEIKQSCMESCVVLKGDLHYPNTPYLPMLEHTILGYSSSQSYKIKNDTTNNNSDFYHLLPFNAYKKINSINDSASLLPRFSHQGNLYLGFSSSLSQELMSLLFQMSTTTPCSQHEYDDRFTEKNCDPIPTIMIEYLIDNNWSCLSYQRLMRNTTQQLQNTGIIELALPEYTQGDTTVMADNEYWLRLSVDKNSACFPGTVNILNNAVLATRVMDNITEPMSLPLPAYTISAAIEDLPDVESITQTMASFGGKNLENQRQYKVQLGERLRHKDRGILTWDYERLVLENFPEIWKTIALPVQNKTLSNQPGNVLLMVLPGPSSSLLMQPTTPEVSSSVLTSISTFLSSRISPFITLHIVNPIYVTIAVDAEISFTDNISAGEGIERLNNALKNYLSPWFYNEIREQSEGRYVTEPYINDFINNQPYVDRLHTLTLNYSPEIAQIASDWYFLTSAENHRLREYDTPNCVTVDVSTY